MPMPQDYMEYRKPSNVRFCCCTGYLYNKDGRCCMDVQPSTWKPGDPLGAEPWESLRGQGTSSDRITIQPQPIAQGWQCPVCASILAPHVDRCPNCGPKTVQAIGTLRDGDTTTLPTWGTFAVGGE